MGENGFLSLLACGVVPGQPGQMLRDQGLAVADVLCSIDLGSELVARTVHLVIHEHLATWIKHSFSFGSWGVEAVTGDLGSLGFGIQ